MQEHTVDPGLVPVWCGRNEEEGRTGSTWPSGWASGIMEARRRPGGGRPEAHNRAIPARTEDAVRGLFLYVPAPLTNITQAL